MTLSELVRVLERLADRYGRRVVTLRDVARFGRCSRPAAGMALLRARNHGLVSRVRNLWLNQLSPPPLEEIALMLVPSSYISFESALYRHGVLSQSPRGALMLATPRRPQRIATPLGTIRFVHLKPRLFFGFDGSRMAHAEKAWLDLVYIRGRTSRTRFALTETVYPERLNRKRLREYARFYPAWVTRLSKRRTISTPTKGSRRSSAFL